MKVRLCLFLLLFAVKGFSLPLGNPSEASLLCKGVYFKQPLFGGFDFRFGYYGDFVYDRFLAVKETDKDIEDSDILNNCGYFVVNYKNRCDLFFTFGTSRFYLEGNAADFNGDPSFLFSLQTDTGWAWSAGARVTLFQYGCTALGISGQYFVSCPSISRIDLSQGSSIYLDAPHNFSYREWQIGLGAAHRFSFFSCYAGVIFSQVHIDLPSETLEIGPTFLTLQELSNRRSIGMACGITLLDSEKMQITIEARFIDSKAIYLNRQVRF